MKSRLLLPALLAGAVVLSATSLLSCGGGSSGGFFFNSKNTSVAVTASDPLQMIGRVLLFLAEETGTADPVGATPDTDFNGNGSFLDRSPVVVDVVANTETNLNVAAMEAHLVGEQVFVVVDEAIDGRDWGGGGGAVVLLTWSKLNPVLTFVDEVEDEGPVVAVGTATKLFYAADVTPAAGESTLRYVDVAQPTTPMTVFSGPFESCGAPSCARSPRILGEDEGILFCLLKESVEGEDLNGDGDDGTTDDDLVMALLDTTDPAAMVMTTDLAVGDEDVPFRAHYDPIADDWWVGFLVSEQAHDELGPVPLGGFNDPADPASQLVDATVTFQPIQCADNDMDLDDDVLFWLRFRPWSMDPTVSPPVNTGLAGVETRAAGGRVVITDAPAHVATVQRESDQGDCDLNQDGDTNDRIARWVEAAPAPTWYTDEDELLALFRAKGGTEGITSSGRHLVIVVDEVADGRDHNMNPAVNLRMIASRDPQKMPPGSGSQWVFDHDPSPASEFYAHTDWLDRLPTGRVVSTVGEKGTGDLNGDGDNLDFVPTLNEIAAGEDRLVFLTPFNKQGAAPQAAGITLDDNENLEFFRVDESQDDQDWNDDNDKNDVCLLRISTSSGFTQYIADIFPQATRCLVAGTSGAAYVADEIADDRDYNNDGDKLDKVVRYFRFQG